MSPTDSHDSPDAADSQSTRGVTAGVTDTFVAHRNLLFTVAYEMLGSAADAEDVLQETWLRWSDAAHAQVREPRAYLVRITTRVALNQLRTLSRRRESYVGPWLPEPLLTAPDIAYDVELADSVSTAMLLVLETLGPLERAVFVLREVFALPFEEIAQAVDRTPTAVRQIAVRARGHVHARRPRQQPSAGEQRAVLERFQAAVAGADLQDLMDVLAPDVVLLTDGGGVMKAALRPIHGAEKVIRFFVGVMPAGDEHRIEQVSVNGGIGLRLVTDGRLDTVATLRIADGRVTGVYLVRNPHKLAHLRDEVALTR